ncbi:response regulator [Mucilaginibacter xinganensis]|uniref:cAMP-binding domain of CRP or a regulatory subunit of cAMP-dependent protein kinases n=1 Tax=Mucilaginibacter xinganensis TaxID=1234841 RepID=A0A223NR41_9SPHI|nr:response regulator [Mucilaginibacter xinganensis]ASU32375.1 cAMP-binding domain of CRP or a regulatory subunit of cAMP-dependent protein kinases [Mucilaginibacter xinganensis]
MNESILVIEDNYDTLESITDLLELDGYTVLQAVGGKRGADMALSHKPDLILCDIMMPGLDGYGVLALLNKYDQLSDIPFIFLTAKTARQDFRKAMEMGADDYLEKPFEPRVLLDAIKSQFSKKEKKLAYLKKALRTIETLTTLSSNGTVDLKGLIATSRIRRVRKMQILYYTGDRSSSVYLVMEGCIKTFMLAEDGREFITGIYKVNDYLGIDSLFVDNLFNETAEAIEDSVLCLLPKEAVESIVNYHPDVRQRFLKMLCGNIKGKEDQMIELAYNSVRKRLAQVLIRLGKQSNEALVKISRDELASMAGIAIETVSRILTDFKDGGLIEKRGSHIKIIELNRLEEMKN